MKNRNISLYGKLYSLNHTTGKMTELANVGWYNFVLTQVPNPNPGNYSDPTGFSYDTLFSTIYTGQKSEYLYGVKKVTLIGPYGGGTIQSYPSWDRTRLFSSALAKMNGKQPGANWSEDAAEASKTAKTAGLFGAAADLNDALTKRGEGIGHFVKNAVGFLSAGTLLTQFGLKPLIQNVFDTANVVLDNSLNEGYVASGSSSESFDQVARITNVNSGSSIPYSVEQTRAGKQGCRIKIWVKPDPNKSPTLDDFSTLNPYLLAWNLMPYSFLFDWAYNVSGYLEAMEQAFKMATRFHKGYYSELYACDISERILNQWNKVSITETMYFVAYGKATRNERHFKRTVLHNWPLPHPPSLEVDLGSGQLLSAAALLGNILGRTPKTPNHKPLGIYGRLGKKRRSKF